jgi:hypothetical protein
MQQIPLDTYNEVMEDLSKKFEKELKDALLQPYPFAPGYSKARSAFGVSPKVASGNLLNSITATYNPNSEEITLEMMDYWIYVNDGRKPGTYAPLDAIKQWIREKGLKGRDKKSGRFITNEKFAWGINTNIKKFGIAPTYFYDKAVENFEKYFEDDVVKALDIDMETFFNKLFELNIEQ